MSFLLWACVAAVAIVVVVIALSVRGYRRDLAERRERTPKEG